MNDELPLLLYVEDEENDVVLLQRALEQAGVAASMVAMDNGVDAVSFLESERGAAVRLLLLDLNLPKRSGLEVLAWVRAQPALNALLTVIFTSSNDPGDRARAQALGIDAYLVKPTSIVAYGDVARVLQAHLAKHGQR